MNMKRFFSILLTLALALGLVPGMTMTAFADGDSTSYTLTIPSTLNVANSGWNATDGISATGTLASGKKLTVTASSGDEYALVNQDDNTKTIGYKLAESGDTTTTYANATEKTAWEFTTLGSTAATQPMGIVVEDYSTKPAGTYTDTVTFTASVAAAVTTVDVGKLQVGDILKDVNSLTGKVPGNGYITLVANRYKENGYLQEGGYSLMLYQISSFSGNTINTSWGAAYTPVNENGQDGNAWTVTGIDGNGLYFAGCTVS